MSLKKEKDLDTKMQNSKEWNKLNLLDSNKEKIKITRWVLFNKIAKNKYPRYKEEKKLKFKDFMFLYKKYLIEKNKIKVKDDKNTKKNIDNKIYYHSSRYSNNNGNKSNKIIQYKNGILEDNGKKIKMNPDEFEEYLNQQNKTISKELLTELFSPRLPTYLRKEKLINRDFINKCNCGCNCNRCKQCLHKNSMFNQNIQPLAVRFIMSGGKLSTVPTDLIPFP
jgi:hypothetical protein